MSGHKKTSTAIETKYLLPEKGAILIQSNLKYSTKIYCCFYVKIFERLRAYAQNFKSQFMLKLYEQLHWDDADD